MHDVYGASFARSLDKPSFVPYLAGAAPSFLLCFFFSIISSNSMKPPPPGSLKNPRFILARQRSLSLIIYYFFTKPARRQSPHPRCSSLLPWLVGATAASLCQSAYQCSLRSYDIPPSYLGLPVQLQLLFVHLLPLRTLRFLLLLCSALLLSSRLCKRVSRRPIHECEH